MNTKKLRYFQDLAASLQFGNGKANRRVQLKMPAEVVEQLDELFPGIDRSRLLTQLAVEAINQQLRFADRAVLRDLIADEQSSLDEMLQYLEERDAGNV